VPTTAANGAAAAMTNRTIFEVVNLPRKPETAD